MFKCLRAKTIILIVISLVFLLGGAYTACLWHNSNNLRKVFYGRLQELFPTDLNIAIAPLDKLIDIPWKSLCLHSPMFGPWYFSLETTDGNFLFIRFSKGPGSFVVQEGCFPGFPTGKKYFPEKDLFLFVRNRMEGGFYYYAYNLSKQEFRFFSDLIGKLGAISDHSIEKTIPMSAFYDGPVGISSHGAGVTLSLLSTEDRAMCVDEINFQHGVFELRFIGNPPKRLLKEGFIDISFGISRKNGVLIIVNEFLSDALPLSAF